MEDVDLEDAIDKAGRDQVFSRAQELGWVPPAPVPKYVWWEIVRDVTAAEADHGV